MTRSDFGRGGLGIYRALLVRPHVARFLFGGVIVQFPYAMVNMALLIGARDVYGSYSSAGVATAVMSIAGAVIGPTIGRLIDRHGQSRIASLVGAFWIASILIGLRMLADRTFQPEPLLAVLVFYGAFQATTGIAIVAFAQERGMQAWAGLVSACFSAGSMIGALVYGMRRWPGALWARGEAGVPYSLADACQDHLLGLAIEESARTGREVVTEIEAWATGV